jgi:flagellar motor switch protein FliN/FliY
MAEKKPERRQHEPVAASAAAAPDAPHLWFNCSLNAAPGASIVVGAAETDWVQLGTLVLNAAGVDPVTPEDARGTWLELIAQATSALANTIAGELGKPVVSSPPEPIDAPVPLLLPDTGLAVFEWQLDGSAPVRLLVAPSPPLAVTLGMPPGAQEPSPPSQPVQALVGPHSKTLDLLMEVELPISVSFGRAQLPLRDVLKLNSGSIVELNRTISEPVEIIVNNCVIARGEVVVVDGNYGVRIQHVVSREERLRTLN